LITDAQRAVRRHFIGSSDCAAACGVDPYKSRVQLWLEKTGRVKPDDLSAVERVHFGNVLEPIVAAEYARRHGLAPGELVRATDTVYDGFRAASVDYYARGRILECKTAGAWMRGAWRSGPPDNYRMQVEHQMMVTHEPEAIIAVLIGGNEYRDHEITTDPELAALIVAREQEFMTYVETDQAPPAESAADVLLLVPVDNRRRILASESLERLADEYHQHQSMAQSYITAADDARERIALALGAHAEMIDSEGKPIANWRAPVGMWTDWRSVGGELAQHVAKAVFDRCVQKHSRAREREFRMIPTKK